ncbi:MAG: V-type ATP synthase subunit F [Treponema sp.]|jgi:V/A-type H+-transporting ATPase subunit F|nr:V-type ATP synthase subunit F [Treponema sp.]
MEYYIIGERELTLAFGLAGVEGAIAVNREEALQAFNQVTGISGQAVVDRPKVLIVTEAVAVMLGEEILDWQQKSAYPLIVEIPGLQGHLEGKKTLTDAIREAVGIHV